jgi:RHS repeat-associated protein
LYLIRNNTWNTPYLFNGKELDEETGLYYYGARYYNPRESVWLSVDPLAEMFSGVSPYAYALLNPVKLIDPDGRGPELPPSNIVNIIKSFNENIFDALHASNNTSNYQLYQWAIGNSHGGYNKLKGAVGEGLALERLRGDNFWGSLIGNAHIYVGGKHNGLQVDIQGKHVTGRYGWGKFAVEVKLGIRSFNFDGSEGSMKEYGNKNKKTYTVNYEVKTLSSMSDVANIYSNLSTGIDQTIERGSGKNNIGVLMTDTDAWNKVASDPTYGPLLQSDYNRLKSTGNHLRLENGLNSDSEKALHSLKDKINQK